MKNTNNILNVYIPDDKIYLREKLNKLEDKLNKKTSPIVVEAIEEYIRNKENSFSEGFNLVRLEVFFEDKSDKINFYGRKLAETNNDIYYALFQTKDKFLLYKSNDKIADYKIYDNINDIKNVPGVFINKAKDNLKDKEIFLDI